MKSPYEISDVAGLKSMGETANLSKSFVLTADIDLNNEPWEPIGSSSAPFNGTFDGDDHTISNMQIDAADKDYQGPFGKTMSPAILRNVRISNVAIIGNGYVGALVGNAYTGRVIENCYITGTIQLTGYYKIGCLIGDGYTSPIRDCTVIGDEGNFVKGLYISKKIMRVIMLVVLPVCVVMGWYKDAACTIPWSFSDAIPADMTMYAKWISGTRRISVMMLVFSVMRIRTHPYQIFT